MPSRFVTLAIVLFWLIMTGWLGYKEWASRPGPGEAPPFAIDLTAEVGANIVNWHVLQKKERIGAGFTRVTRGTDRTYEFYAEFKLERPFRVLLIELHELKSESSYHVSDEGLLRAASAKLKSIVHVPFFEPAPMQLVFQGEVRDGRFQPRLEVTRKDQQLQLPTLESFPVAEKGSILNPMHLVHKITGLREGASWRVPLLDPMRVLPTAVRDLLTTKEIQVPELIATVSVENMEWNNAVEPCYKISYAKKDEQPLAATWVRRRDSIVLQQWAGLEGVEYTFQRVPER